jgi:hypothetical protein
VIGGVYVGALANRDVVAVPQLVPGSLSAGAAGTALLGPSPDGSCRAVFSVVTADGAIVQEHTVKGLDGLAPAAQSGPSSEATVILRTTVSSRGLGVLVNPYAATPGAAWQLFVSEPSDNTSLSSVPPNLVFGSTSVSRISSPSLNLPVNLAVAQRDADSINRALEAARYGDAAPFSLQIRVFGVVERPRVDWREKRRRQGADKTPEGDACSPEN